MNNQDLEELKSDDSETAECSAYPNLGSCTHRRCLLRERDRLSSELEKIARKFNALHDPNIQAYNTVSGGLVVSLIDEDATLLTLSFSDRRYAHGIAYALLQVLTPGGSNAKTDASYEGPTS